jgi:hypothetical protein
MQWTGYSLTTGQKLWGPVGNQTSWDFFGNPAANYAQSQLAYGKLYSINYGGILYCYDLQTGNLLWNYGTDGSGNDTSSGFYTPYGHYPTALQAVGNGVVYLATTEHTVETPIYKGSTASAVNATTGQLLWQLSDYTGEFITFSYAIADGYSTFFNGFDNQIYSVGRGPSQTTVSAPNAGLAFGQSVVISGKVLDISSGTKQTTVAADFPNGVPVSSETSMADMMRYIYQQGPHPANFTGVPVDISVIDSNNNLRSIGTATTDVTGAYTFTWTPNIVGNYTVIATFPGTNGYWPSYGQSSFNVMQSSVSPTPTGTSGPSATSMTDTYVLGSAIAIIVVIIIIGILLMMMLSRRP